MLTQEEKNEMIKDIREMGFSLTSQYLLPFTLEKCKWDKQLAIDCILYTEYQVGVNANSPLQSQHLQSGLIQQQVNSGKENKQIMLKKEQAGCLSQQLEQLKDSIEETQLKLIIQQSLDKQDEISLSERLRLQGYPVGLQNFGNTCYFNCILQIIFANPTLQKAIFDYRPDNTQKSDIIVKQQKFMKELQIAMVRLMLSNEKYRKPQDVYIAAKELRQVENKNNDEFKVGQFYDVSEYLEVILSLIDQSLKQRKSEKEFNPQLLFENQIMKDQYCIVRKLNQSEQFSSQLILYPKDQLIYCSLLQDIADKEHQPQLKTIPNNLVFTLPRTTHEINKQIKYETEYWFSTKLYLDFLFDDEVATQLLQEYLQNSQSPQEVVLQNQLLKEIQAFQNVIKLIESKKIVPVDVVHSIRLEMNIKIEECMKYFPKNIEMLNEKLGQNSKFQYHLYIVVVHAGSALTGHYYMYAYNFCQNKWFKYNDSNISIELEEDVLKDSRMNGNMLIYINESQKQKVTQYQQELQKIDQRLFKSMDLTTENSRINALRCIPQNMIQTILDENKLFYCEYLNEQQVLDKSKIEK